ncbi:MAG: CHASE2 domain-containing protein, partial [Candidatus Melainabacteria bacterium]|nr:CHASE2 domain-containing protein [Candidatus Melainabacteria bacterium]
TSFAYEVFKVAQNKKEKAIRLTNNIYLQYPKQRIEQYSFIDLIQGKIPNEALKDKVVFIGLALKSKILTDNLFDPFGNNVSDSKVQAVAVSNLLDDSYLFKVSLSKSLFLFILSSMIFGALFTNLPAVRGLILGSALIALLMIFGQVAYSYMRLAIEVVPSFLMLTGNLVIGSLIYLQLNLQEQNVELENALMMLNQKTKELENSKLEIEGKNIRLSDALSELNNKINELGIVRKQVSYKREEERKRIARELHDDTLARITDLKLHIESIIYSNKMSIEDNKQLGACIPILDSVTREVRRTINALRPSMLDNALGLLPAIENLLDELGKRTNYSVKTKFATSLLKLKLNELHEIHIYRIVQEALNNIYKHANATNVEVVIEEQFGQLLVLVSDNGVGINVERKTNGFGILDMKERAELIGAKLQYINKPSNFGATLELTVPLKQNDLFVLEKKESVAKS